MESMNDALKNVAKAKELISIYLNNNDRFILKELEEAELLLEQAIDILAQS